MNDHAHRVSQRFELQLPAIVKPYLGADVGDSHLVLTRDISDQGVYFNVMNTSNYPDQVQVEILLQVSGHDSKDVYVCMTTRGEVVRRETEGLAVKFVGKSRMVLMTKTT